MHISMQLGRRITGRVDADEQNPDLIGQRSQLSQHAMQMHQGQRTHIRAMGIAKIKQADLATKISRCGRLTRIIGQLKGQIGHMPGDIGQLPMLGRLALTSRGQQQ
ncbi:was-like protein [Lasius niger]|uniref:Was-like protein n=1 Tax=Lasius niger TaxID=67767 RepID=A0A0J7MQR4_LASNI|nr:was-like protein [Lasius niger]